MASMPVILRWLWMQSRLAWALLNPVRFSVLVVLLAGYALYANDQAQDLLAGLGEDRFKTTLFVLAVCWWALQGWGWARWALNRAFAGGDGRTRLQRFFIRHLPRATGIGAFALAAIAAYTAAAPAALIAALLGLAVVMYVGLVYRRRLRVSARRPRWMTSRVWAIGSYAVVLSCAVAAVAWPVAMGDTLGSGAVVFLGLGCLVPVGTWLVDAARNRGFPVLSLLLLLAILFSACNDNHAVRALRDDAGIPGGAPPDVALETALQAFRRGMGEGAAPTPLVLVAAAGGGLRASYWTAVVLGELQRQVPGFQRHLFAISSVSGGSVGSVFYAAAQSAAPGDTAGVLEALGQDYLAPAAVGLLYGDLMQRFLPVALFADRAAALERGWEAGFRRAFPRAECGLDVPFRRLWADPGCAAAGETNWLPILLINGTHQETGRRIITSHVAIDPNVFLDADDFYRRNGGRAIPVSTAAHNGARFAYVSPAGTFSDGADPAVRGHILDGGYFENFGAETLRDLLRWLRDQPAGGAAPLRPIVIVISNDVDLAAEFFSQDELPPGSPPVFLNEVRAPLYGLLNARGARGILAVKALRRDVENYCAGRTHCAEPVFVLFHLQRTGNFDPPLGWVLSEAAKANMQAQIRSAATAAALRRVAGAFHGAARQDGRP